MPEFNFSTFDSSLLPEIKNYLAQKNASHLLNLSKGKLTEVSTELFKELLVDMGLKTFIGWNLTHVDFKSIDHDLKKSNKDSQIFVAIDFSYANLTAVQLDDLNFSNSSFIGANLKNTNLSNSLFNAANFSLADLNGAKLSKAQFIAANLIKATLNYVNGTEVNFNKANLKHAKLNHAYLSESDFLYADLSYAELNMINLDGSDLRGVNLNQAQINNAKLIETIWTSGYLKNANFKKSVLTGAIFEHANLQEVQFTHANLQKAQLNDADLFRADLYGCNLQQADLSRANLTQVILHSANLNYANLRGAKLNEMSLLHTSVTGVNLEATPIDQVNLNHRRPWYGPTLDWSLVKEENLKKYPVRIPTFKFTQKSSAAFLSRCLPTQWDPPSDCKISWRDVDKLAFNRNYTCDVNKIVIKSESFLSDFKSLDEDAQQQWLQFAEAVKVAGNAVDKLNGLIQYKKIAALMPQYKQYILSRLEQLKNSTTGKDVFLNFKEKTSLKRELLFNRPIDLQPISENNNTFFVLNNTLFDINTFSITKNNASYAISIDFLSNEIRELLEITQAISIYKWLSSPETLFFYQLKSDSNLIESSRNWLRGTLNASEYSRMLIKYPEIFNPCQFSCNNLTISNPTLIRYMLTQLVSPTNFKRPIVNVVRNVSAVLPYKTVLKFSHAELMLEDEQNWLGHIISHLSITEIIDSYFKVVNRLNTSLMVTNPATHEVIMLGSSKDQQFNHLNYACRVVGGEKLVISGYDKFNFTQLPLPSVTVHGSKETGTRLIDFRILARQIQKNFNSNLDVKLVPDNNDLIIQRFFQISSATNKKNIPVISVHLKNALVDRWYQKVEIILNTAPTKITGRGLKMQIKPIPYPFPTSNSSVDFLSLARLEKNSAVIIPAWMDHDSLFRVEDSLIITNALAPSLEWKKLYFLVLRDLDKQPEKAFTHTLEFTDKTVVLAEKLNEIFYLSEDWDSILNQHKKNLYGLASQVGIRDGYVSRHKDACREREYFSSYDAHRFRRSAMSGIEQTAKKVDHTTTNAKFNLTKALTETDLVIYSKKPKSNNLESIASMIPLPASACLGGLLSAHFDHLGEMYQEKCPSLPAYMTYGFKPFMLVLISSGSNAILFNQDEEIEEKFARFFTYFMFNFLGVIVGQPLTQKIAETIHNKLMCFFVQSLTWALLWNPSLFASEYLDIIPVVCMQLLQGLFFKTGEETYTLAKKTCNSPSSFWRKKVAKSADQDQVLNKGEIKQVQVAFA